MKTKGALFDEICEIAAISKLIQDLKFSNAPYHEIQKAQQRYDEIIDNLNEE